MNILMLGWELPPHNSGGLGVACYHLSKALAIQGASIDFVVPYDDPHEGIDFMNIHSAARIAPDSLLKASAYDSQYYTTSQAGSGFSHIRSIQNRYASFVETLAKKSRPDVIHAHDWLTMEAGVKAKKVTGSPLVIHVHATEFDRSGEHYGNPLVHEIEQQALQIADRIIAVSNITKALIVQKYGIPENSIEVVHNGIDANSFTDYTYDSRGYKYFESLKSEGYTVVAAVSRLTVQKGLTHFLRAAAKASERHDRFIFLIAGDGEQRDELIRLSADLGIAEKVYFTGYVRGKQWRDVYSLADIFVMSSVSEPFGLSALEAAHHGAALLISNQSGVGEVLKHVLRFDYWDTSSLADRMIGIATSPALRNELSRGVLSEYSTMNWDGAARKCIDIFDHTKKFGVAAV